jgi:hypothetical protein
LAACAGFKLPDPNSPVYDEALDYQDVKLKIIQQEGYDAHDFNLFDDRASLLWRKPYVDGAVRELTAGNGGRPLSSYATPWNSSCWLLGTAIPMFAPFRLQPSDHGPMSKLKSMSTSKKR